MAISFLSTAFSLEVSFSLETALEVSLTGASIFDSLPASLFFNAFNWSSVTRISIWTLNISSWCLADFSRSEDPDARLSAKICSRVTGFPSSKLFLTWTSKKALIFLSFSLSAVIWIVDVGPSLSLSLQLTELLTSLGLSASATALTFQMVVGKSSGETSFEESWFWSSFTSTFERELSPLAPKSSLDNSIPAISRASSLSLAFLSLRSSSIFRSLISCASSSFFFFSTSLSSFFKCLARFLLSCPSAFLSAFSWLFR